MSFVMIAPGPTSSGARVRTVPIRALALAGVLAALLLLAAGVGLGWWIAAPAAAQTVRETATQPAAPTRPQAASHALPFALEQLGALSGRLFRLESQARQLSDRLGTRSGARGDETSRPEPSASTASGPGAGGPMLPPRAGGAALDQLDALLARFTRIEQQLALVADASAQQRLALMRLPTLAPIADAELTSSFGNRADPLTGRQAFHAGLDFAAGSGTAVHAAAGGRIVFAGFRSDYGWMVEIAHGNGLSTRYAHASRLLVRRDGLVAPGDIIALSGSTGRSTGPHLHFEVLRHGEHVDPRRYLAAL